MRLFLYTELDSDLDTKLSRHYLHGLLGKAAQLMGIVIIGVTRVNKVKRFEVPCFCYSSTQK